MAYDTLGGLHGGDLIFCRGSGGIRNSGGKFQHIYTQKMLIINPSALAIAIGLGSRITLQILKIPQQAGMRIKTRCRFLILNSVAADKSLEFYWDVFERVFWVFEFRLQFLINSVTPGSKRSDHDVICGHDFSKGLIIANNVFNEFHRLAKHCLAVIIGKFIACLTPVFFIFDVA